LKTTGFAAIAIIGAMILGFGARLSAPTAHADTTAVRAVKCVFLASGIDGDLTDTIVGADVDKACGIAPMLPADIVLLANTIGDKDGVLTASDLDESAGWTGGQLRAACTAAGLYCTLDVFVFVNDEKPVNLDLPSGLASVQNGLLDFLCTAEGSTLTLDNDCIDTTPNNGDGIVVFNVLGATAVAGDVKNITVTQEAVDQSFDVTMTGEPHNVALTLAESTIQTNASTTTLAACMIGNAVADASSLSQAETTVGIAVVTDSDGTELTGIPVGVASGTTTVAAIATGTAGVITSNTDVSLDAGTSGVASFFVICGGKTTGTAKITATINATTVAEDKSSQTITVVGAPDAVALTASPAQIACDGTQTSSVTAKVTDSAGNNVADGNTVSFSVVALGTANPINAKTAGGSASSTITPLSGSTAGVTVIVTAGSAQASIRVDCSLPIPPTAVPPGAVPTAKVGGTIGGPDTGNGGYLGQDGSAGIPTWTLVALALGSVALVAGGMVTRRAGK
jgi:hypothetical protein